MALDFVDDVQANALRLGSRLKLIVDASNEVPLPALSPLFCSLSAI